MDMDGQRYTVTDFLGSGAYGCVYEAMDNTTNERVALKQMTMDNNELSKNVIREISILMEMDHENLVRLKRVFIENEYLYLVMECLDTNFKAHRKDIASKYRSPAIIKILRGVEYSHSRGVLHRDLKMENILLDKSVGRVKIADFGSARGFVDLKSTLTPEVTTVNYRAPEVLLGKPYSTAIDMWSVGCIFVEMVTNKYLFPGDSEIQVLDKIYSMVGFDGKVSFPAEYAKDLLAVLDAAGLDLLSKLLQLNPDKRISSEAALEHEYLKHVDVTDPRVVFMGFSTSAT